MNLIILRNRVQDYKRLLGTAISSQDFAHQSTLETQIIEFKNLVDSSMPIRQYLLESKYVQLVDVTNLKHQISNQSIELEVEKRGSEKKEQVLQMTDKNINQKLHTKDMNMKLTNNKKTKAKATTKRKSEVYKLDDKLIQKMGEIKPLNNTTNNGEKVAKLEEKLVESDSKLAEVQEKLAKNDAKLTELSLINDELKTANTKLESKIGDIEAELGKVNEESKMKDILIEELKDQHEQELENLQKSTQEVLRNAIIEDPKFKLDLDLIHTSDNDKMKEMSESIVADFDRVRINNLTNNDPILKSFFENSCPTNLSFLSLNLSSKYQIKISYYMDELKEWFKATSDEIYLESMHITSNDLTNIIKSSSRCNRLVIRFSRIDASQDLDFDIDTGYTTKELSFYNCDCDSRSNWDVKRNEVVKILEAINNCGLKHSLQKISLYNFNGYPDSLDEAQKIAEDAGLAKNLIVFEQWEPTTD